MTTLRREAIQTVYKVLAANIEKFESEYDLLEIAEYAVDKLSHLRGFSVLKDFDTEKAGIDWAVAAGLHPDNMNGVVEREQIWVKARDSFEVCLQLQLNWYPAKTSDERVMKKLRESVVRWYTEDPNCFRDYQTWRTQEFVRGALSNVQIKSYPENFEASWSDFRRTMPLKVAKAIKTDDGGSPITY